MGPNGEQVGVVRIEDALRLAQEADLDGDLFVLGGDFTRLLSLFGKTPGPSGLACAGTTPCTP